MIELEISGLAVRSLLMEAALAPKPGLVTPYDNGSHKDMDFETFARSALALSDCFAECAATGRTLSARPPEESLVVLKKNGIDGEKAMYEVTNGVNTHKGAIYLLGLLCAAAGRIAELQRGRFTPHELAKTAAAFVKGVVERELANSPASKEPATAGERAYAAHGLTGARGEAERGYPLTLSALDYLLARVEYMSFEIALTDTFFFIVSRNDDTNIYSRGGMDGLKMAKEYAGEVLLAGGANTSEGRERIRAAERAFVKKNLSPGGSADILSSCVFLMLLSERK